MKMVKQDFEEWFLSGLFGFHQLGDTQMQSPTRFGHSEQFLGGWVVLVLRGLGVVAHF